MQPLQIRSLEQRDLENLKLFTDLAIGSGYYSIAEHKEIFERSIDQKTHKMCTLLLVDENQQIQGVRLTYPPGNWNRGKGKGLTEDQWPYSLSQTAYFQSLFVHPDLVGKGFGRELSLKAIEILKQIGAKGIVCHSWKESPHDSSNKYLTNLGFKKITSHPLYWKEVDYSCTRCGNPCFCTADEMYLEIV